MGYTHYWYRKPPEPKDAYGRLLIDTSKIIAACQERGIVFGDGMGDAPFDQGRDLTEGVMHWNGIGEDSHETFYWEAPTPEPEEWQRDTSDGAFNFCKTARKPYDIAVCAVLIRAKVHYGDSIRVSSNGDWDAEWQPAAMLCAELFGDAVCPLNRE